MEERRIGWRIGGCARERKKGEVTRNHEEHKSRGFRRRSRFRNQLPRAKDSNSLLPNIGKAIFSHPRNVCFFFRWKNPVPERHLRQLSLKSRRRFTLFARYPFKAYLKMKLRRFIRFDLSFSCPRLLALVESEILLPLPFQFSALSDYFQVRCTFVRGNFRRGK